ncbi:MAG: efflux RND transporter periplasmic adaptor subunit [Pseudomonadota bacterium]
MVKQAKRRRFFVGVILIAVIGFVGSQLRAQDQAAGNAPVRAVKLISPSKSASVQTRNFFGRVVARETVDLSFEVPGRLVELPVEEGQAVAKGELLARLEAGDFERNVIAARLELERTERDLERASALASRNVASAVRAEDARTVRDLAKVALETAEEALRDATLHAPYDGLVAARITPNYSNITPGTPILRLHDMSQTRVEIEIPEQLLQLTPDLDDITFTGRTVTAPDGFQLKLIAFEAQTAQIGQTFLVTLAVAPDAGRALLPGKSVTVTAELPATVGTFSLPASAILSDDERGTYVMAYSPGADGTGTVGKMPVDLTSTSGRTFLTPGLDSHLQIVEVGGHLLREGQRVRPYRGLTVKE